MQRVRFSWAVALPLAAIMLRAAPALASDEAAAETLFLEAKKLLAAGRTSEACPKFAESNRLDRGAGTLIHLADCYEKNGQSASAWATFKDAASAAQALGRSDWQKLATQRAANLEPKLAKLTIGVDQPDEKIEVTRDGSPTSPASWGSPIPVDLGMHTVQASAPGKKPYTTTVTLSKDGERSNVVVPKLEPQQPSGAAGGATGAASGRASGRSQRTLGFVVGGLGVAGVAVGVVTGLIALGKNSDSKQACPNDGPCSNRDAVALNDDARTYGTVSTVGFIAGGVALAAGALLILTAPSSSARSAKLVRGVRVVGGADDRSAGMSLLGVF